MFHFSGICYLLFCYFEISFFRYYDITLLRQIPSRLNISFLHFYIFHFLQFLHQEAAAVDDLNNSYAGACGEEIAIGEGTDFMNTTIHTDLHLASC